MRWRTKIMENSLEFNLMEEGFKGKTVFYKD